MSTTNETVQFWLENTTGEPPVSPMMSSIEVHCDSGHCSTPNTSCHWKTWGPSRRSRRVVWVLTAITLILAIKAIVLKNDLNGAYKLIAQIDRPVTFNVSSSSPLFCQSENFISRHADITDTFANYKYRNTCNISSLDLHQPFAPLCSDRQSMIDAMSGGGRIGYDAPYIPRGCDMRWFSSEEVCEILSRFEKVIIVGDSMMRHVIGSINVMIRKDLGYGAVTDWNFSPQERQDCFCNDQFDVKACSIQGIFKTADVIKNDPESVSCPAGTIDVMIEQMIRFPIPSEELDRLRGLLPSKKPKKPYAFVFGHGLWNDLDLQVTLDWLDLVLETISGQAPWLSPAGTKPKAVPGHHERKHELGFWPRLFLTPNAAGKEKPDEWIVTQGNKALMLFEEGVRVEGNKRGLEHLGTWNMSIQSNKFDGVHVDLKGNLIKAMMVMNWLNMLEVDKF